MISVEEATNIILKTAKKTGEELVPISDAIGRTLLEPLVADRDFPPFDRVTMDGIAIDFDAFASGRTEFKIESIGAAGSPQATLHDKNNCIEIMTGAVRPKNTDTVIRYEDISVADGKAQLNITDLKKGQNIHGKGFDRNAGELLVPSARQLSAAEIGIAATVGKAKLKVTKLPKVIILSTGDELVEIEQNPQPHQIRRSNSYSLKAVLHAWGINADIDHLPDDKAYISKRISEILSRYQLIVMSGGVSKGKFDYLPVVLEELGCETLFHRVAQRPGKPFWFGQSAAGTSIFALPGNPVSTFMCAQRYLIPWLNASVGIAAFTGRFAELQEEFSFKPALTYFLQVKTSFSNDARLLAFPIAGGGSGDLANLPEADGFLELPADRTVFKKGECFPYFPFR